MKVIEHLQQAKQTLFSYEVVPPLRGTTSIEQLFEIIEKLLPFAPKWINVTTHASSMLKIEKPDGQIKQLIHKKRPGTMGICGVIQNKYNIDAVAHVLCQGYSKQETEDALIDLKYMGIDNILALKGDNLNYNRQISEHNLVNENAVDLVTQVNKMQQGLFQNDTEYLAMDFCVGVATYPEKHFEAQSLELNIEYLLQKQQAGAQYAITQMFFDNQKYFEYVAKCRQAGITIPIIPGIKILKTAKQVETLPRIFHISLPGELVNSILHQPENAEQIGLNWAKKQVRELIKAKVPCVHFFLMNDVDNVIEVIKEYK